MENKNKDFDVNKVVYSAESDGDGGAIIVYHTIKSRAIVEGWGSELVQGEMTKVRMDIPSINTDKMESNMYLPESNFFTLEELPTKILEHINKKKYY
jgi:hypothetical protein